MKTIVPYFCEVRFKDRSYKVRLYPTEENPNKFVMEIETKGWLSGDVFSSLKHYLQEEGYIDQAYEYYNC